MQVYSSQKARYKLFLQTFLVICFSQNPSHYKLLLQKRCQGQELIQAIYYRYLLPQIYYPKNQFLNDLS